VVRSWVATLWLSALTIAAAPVLADSETGNLFGTAVDNNGEPLPGVTVTLTGPGAPMTQITNAEGQFRFLGLPPGEYRLRAELDGFSPVEYPNVHIQTGRNTALEVSLTPAIEETIVVTNESPLLDERRIGRGASVSQVELEKIPTARDPWAVLQSVPGVLTDRINVGGNETGQPSHVIGPGSESHNNVFAVDGVVITDFAVRGKSPNYYAFDTIEEMQVTTGGTDISLATGGVTLNMVTKRGTNAWRMSGRYALTDDAFRADPAVPSTPLDTGAIGNRDVEHVDDLGFEAGGPLVRDRLWIWGAYGRQNLDSVVLGGGNPVRDDTQLENFAAKLNGQLADGNSLSVLWSRSDKSKVGEGAGFDRPAETTWHQTVPTDIFRVSDSHAFSSNF